MTEKFSVKEESFYKTMKNKIIELPIETTQGMSILLGRLLPPKAPELSRSPPWQFIISSDTCK